MYWRTLVITLALFHSCHILLNADTGVITGRVTDQESGVPIFGADVYLQGTDLGAATDTNGKYSILNIPAGTYMVNAVYVGYHEFVYLNIVVNAQDTLHLNFKLRPYKNKVLLDEKPSLFLNYMQTQNLTDFLFSRILYHRCSDYEAVAHRPFATIDEVFVLQPGIVRTDSGMHMHGGKHSEMVYYLDGIETRVPNLGIQPAHLALSGTDRISIIKGGLNAEYGNALSGIVNISPKQGGAKHHMSLHYLTDEIFSNDRMNYGYNKYDFSFSGPIPVMRGIRYFIGGELLLTDAYETALYKIPSPRNDYQLYARMNYISPNARSRIAISGFRSREQQMFWKPVGNDTMSELIYLFEQPMQRSKTWMTSVKFEHMPNPRTFISLLVGLTHFDRVYGSRDYIWEDEQDQTWFDDYRLKNENLIDYLLSDTIPVLDILLDSINFSEPDYRSFRKDQYGIKGLFTYVEEIAIWSLWQNNDIQIRGDILRSLGKHYEAKIGFEYVKYDIRYYHRKAPPYSNILNDFRYYHKNPYKLAAYLQDKIDLEGIIANLGVRFDLFDANIATLDPQLYLWYDSTITITSETITTISPRTGVSLPVSDKMRFRFAYGHYYQVPAFDYIYNTSDINVLKLLLSNGVNVLGNISLKPEKLIAYEAGIEKIYQGNIFLNLNVYYKDYDNLLQLRKIQALPEPRFQYFNDGHSTVKGTELMIKKSLNDIINFGISYTLQYVEGASAWAHKDYYVSDIEPPVINYWLDQDERHNISGHVDLIMPNDFSLSPLQNLTNSIVFSYHSGQPYTLKDLAGSRLEHVNSSRMPGYWNVDWKISRHINTGLAKFVLTCLINNLLDTKQITRVYPITGAPDDHGYPGPSPDQFDYVPVTSSYYSPQADHDHDGLITPMEFQYAYRQALDDYYDNPTFYNNGFRMRLGIGIEF